MVFRMNSFQIKNKSKSDPNGLRHFLLIRQGKVRGRSEEDLLNSEGLEKHNRNNRLLGVGQIHISHFLESVIHEAHFKCTYYTFYSSELIICTFIQQAFSETTSGQSDFYSGNAGYKYSLPDLQLLTA